MDQEFQPASGYCRQRANSLRIFDCLFNYNKMPERDFEIDFSYDKDGKTGALTVPIKPSKSQTKSRSFV